MNQFEDLEKSHQKAVIEIARLKSTLKEYDTLKDDMKSAEDDKKSMQNQVKKMRRFVRQSVFTGAGPSMGMMKPMQPEGVDSSL